MAKLHESNPDRHQEFTMEDPPPGKWAYNATWEYRWNEELPEVRQKYLLQE